MRAKLGGNGLTAFAHRLWCTVHAFGAFRRWQDEEIREERPLCRCTEYASFVASLRTGRLYRVRPSSAVSRPVRSLGDLGDFVLACELLLEQLLLVGTEVELSHDALNTLHGFGRRASAVHDEEVLQCGWSHHTTCKGRAQVAHEALPHRGGAEGVEAREHQGDLLVAGVGKFDVHVCAAVADQGRVQPLAVVCGEDEDLAIRFADAVERIQEPGKRQRGVFDEFLAILAEDCINIFEDQDRLFGSLVDGSTQRLVGQSGMSQVHVAKIMLEVGSKSLDQRGLARARHAIEEVASLVRDAVLLVP
mmetsp:Transcript_104529/g.336908  ORF Transcript_104529/g.336908 Transcript_104529/m.336908 type:complete len:305 (-) Transcript_104529:782-1696(-)